MSSRTTTARFPEYSSAAIYHTKVHNRHLTEVDLYNNYDTLEREAGVVIPDFYQLSSSPTAPLTLPWTPRPKSAVIDLRTPSEFAISHLPGAVNIPISTLTPDSPSPFTDSQLFAAQWRELEVLFGGGTLETASPLAEKFFPMERVLVVCNDGDTARVAGSILGAKGAKTECVSGGLTAIDKWIYGDVKNRTLGELKIPDLPDEIAAVPEVNETKLPNGHGPVGEEVKTATKVDAEARVGIREIRTNRDDLVVV
ncbi:uncharacterized protein LY89DRAFT_726632 [Mollisia scopiformis]|uniref:Rhodanese domain-containing protein n=1 Tax=Mollisia scopiformis TaxID=149040 RepID=A0A132B1S4_MOLSC|nr:uncharacterized protein LY89DRAFT_726632 [Mollisia scopiformis]KUJ06322.1 hypothetical protein LY89DRAFT_726632 [Mollisia scopiformis]